MKKIIITGAALAAISVLTVSAFAVETPNKTDTSALYAANTISSQCTQEYCPQDGTGNRYGAESESSNNGICNPSCPQYGTGNRYGTDNENKNTNRRSGNCNGVQGDSCTNLCNGSQKRLRLYYNK